MQPRAIQLKDAPSYLGMNKNKFNALVRPYVCEVPCGRTVQFDRLDLDGWWEDYKKRNGRTPKINPGGNQPCLTDKRQASSKDAASITSTKGVNISPAAGFAAALEQLISKKQKTS